MSKNTVDRRKSTFKARDNVEIIMNKIFTFIESNLSSEIVPQIENAGSWKVENDKAKIEISFDSAYHNLDGKTIILKCEWDNKVGASTTNTWLMGNYRTRLIDATFQLMEHIDIANGIHPISMLEFNERRLNQDFAIIDCYHILHILQRIIDAKIGVTASTVEHIVELIDEEIRLLKGWRKAEYKKRKSIQKRELE